MSNSSRHFYSTCPVADPGGGSRGSGPPPFGPQCRLFNIGPQSWTPPFCECPRVGVFFNFSDGG